MILKMTDRTPNNFLPDSGWTVRNLNAVPAAFQPPPYHQVANFATNLPPSHFVKCSTNDSSNVLKNVEYQKFNPPVCQTFNINSANAFEMNQYSNSKQQQKSNFLNPIPPIPHNSSNQTISVPSQINSLPLQPPNYTKPLCPPPVFSSIANNDKNFINAQQMSTLSSSHPMNALTTNLPISESAPVNNLQSFSSKTFNASNNVLPYGNVMNIPLQQTVNTCVQSSIPIVYSIPPPVVKHSVKSENTPDCIGNLQQLRFLPPPFAPQNNLDAHPFNMMMVPPPPAYPQMPYPPMSLTTPAFTSGEQPGIVLEPAKQKEQMLASFLQKFQKKGKGATKNTLTVVEFRSALKVALSLSKRLLSQNLSSFLQCGEDQWNTEKQRILELKDELSEVCSFVSNPHNLCIIQKKLRTIKKKRKIKARLKQEAICARKKQEQEQKMLHQEIDKWLDGIKEKNLKLKREIEMKKEADKILSEVRKKSHEAKKTIEKLKVFEKLRTVRQMNAQQKGLFVAAEHSAVFERKLNAYRGLLHKQVEVYEEEERALRVMLEEEQEGQLEEEVLWRREKLKSLQKKKQANIMQCLFGDKKDPAPEDPLFLFHQHQNAGNCSIKSLVQIRHHWDDHLAENGDPMPQQWIVPVPPSSTAWETVCQN